MAYALPVVKLVGLLFQTLAKPVAKRIKTEFSRNATTRQVLIGLGQGAHQVTSRLTIWSAGYKIRSINPLEEDKALSLGADLVSEMFILSVSGGVVVWEYQRGNREKQQKDAEHRAKIKAEQMALQAKLNTLHVRAKALEAVVKENSQSILHMGQVRYVEPKDIVSMDDDDHNDDENDSAPEIASKNQSMSSSSQTVKDNNSVQSSSSSSSVFQKVRQQLAHRDVPTSTGNDGEEASPPSLPAVEAVPTVAVVTTTEATPTLNGTKPWWKRW